MEDMVGVKIAMQKHRAKDTIKTTRIKSQKQKKKKNFYHLGKDVAQCVELYSTYQKRSVTFTLVIVTNVTKDRIVAVDDITLPLSVLPGTEVAFTTSETVTVNDVAHEAVDGVHTVVITEETTIVVGEEPATGLNAATTAVKAVKQLREGQIVIIKNGVEYNVLGAEIR